MVAEDAVCYRHADRIAAVGCQRCDRPVCSSCMHSASVGFHCPECTKSGAQKVYRAHDLQSKPTLTYVLMGLSLAAFVAQGIAGQGNGFTNGTVYLEGVLFGPFVKTGDYWRIVTSGFLHGGLMHIAFNMYALYIFGPTLERAIGWARVGLIYAGGLFGGSAAVLLFNWGTPTLGASGAVLGLAGGLAAVLWSRGVSITQTSLGGIFIINLGLPLLIGGISFWGHLGGILGGALVGAIIGFGPSRLRQTESTTLSAAVAVVVGLAALAVVGAQIGA